MLCKYVCLILFSTPHSQCANILALVPTTSYSHQIAYAPLWKALSLNGHNVTLLTPNPMNNPKLTNLTEISMNWAYQFVANLSYKTEFEITMWNFHTTLSTGMDFLCDKVLSSHVGQDLLHNEHNFDLVFVENVCPELLGFAEIYNCPKVLIATMSLSSIFYNILGDFAHPISHPEFVVSFQGQLSFRERLISTIVTLYLHYTFAYILFPKKQKMLQTYFNNTSTIPELIRSIDMLFLNENPHLHGPRPTGPATITIGGHRDDLSLESLPTVLWKFETKIINLPENIRTAKWLPQQKILNHPNLKLFICQGGLQSIEEAIYGEVPFVIIPFIADQFQNAKMLENKDIAIVLDRKTLTKNVLNNAIMKVMNDTNYYEGVKKLKKLILDEPMTGLQKAVWWTEYIIRNKGAKHLKNPAASIPLYQYYLLDVIGMLMLIVTLIITALVLALKKISKLLCRFHHRKQK
ncbi:UDP-glucuronosyltransferase 2B15-like [Anoplophora glabripennis]|uniref:UDP-glucuronosyltransferase 2B15-like n=1 Tax=Anoplophora glabripennis TaxID=217634 RepID=UPI000875190D|nr:UDP-glucuronosyltransferase 2B15-like [Anoplophora glabripennis]